MPMHVCPWWLAFLIDNRFRRWFQDPERILDGLVREGQTVLDLGCGMGYFTLPLARMVGKQGRVIAVDLQPGMLRGVKRRAERAGLLSRITLHQASKNSLALQAQADFALAFAMVHELPNAAVFLAEVACLLKPGARFLVVEPRRHVRAPAFEETVATACRAGFTPLSRPLIKWSHAALFKRP